MTDSPSPTDAFVARLLDDDHRRLRAGVELAIDYLFSRRLDEVIDLDPAVIATWVTDAVTAENVEHVVSRHASPIFDRQHERERAQDETLAAWLPEDGRERVLAIVSVARPEPPAWAATLVDPALVASLVAPVVQDMLIQFARQLPVPGLGAPAPKALRMVLGGKSGKSGKSGKGGKAETKEAGADSSDETEGRARGLLGGVVGGVDKKLRDIARDFSLGAVDQFRAAFIRRLRTDEGRAILQRLQTEVVDNVLAIPVPSLLAFAETLPRQELEAIVPDVLAHNARREVIRSALAAEIEAALAVEGARTLRDIADQAGVGDALRAQATSKVTTLAADFLRGEAIGAWLTDALSS